MLNMLKLPLIATILLSSGCVAVAPSGSGYAYSTGNYYGSAYYSPPVRYYAPPVRYYNPPPIYVAPPRVVVVRERPRWSNPDRRRYDHRPYPR
jgi:hypothetical protein